MASVSDALLVKALRARWIPSFDLISMPAEQSTRPVTMAEEKIQSGEDSMAPTGRNSSH
jgi:hypothetical protein